MAHAVNLVVEDSYHVGKKKFGNPTVFRLGVFAIKTIRRITFFRWKILPDTGITGIPVSDSFFKGKNFFLQKQFWWKFGKSK